MSGHDRETTPTPAGSTTVDPPDTDRPIEPAVPPSGPSDTELLHAHVNGDQHAFAALFHRHRNRIWAVALRTIGDREEAADALQDALLSAHRNAARFRGDSAVTTWLHRIVVNACLDRIRRRKAHPTVPLPDGSQPADGSAAMPEPAAPVADHDTALVVRAALADLPAEQRAALVLVDMQGYSVAEAARILDVAEGTVKSRCARGRARLALRLGHLKGRPEATARTRTTGGRPDTDVPSQSGGHQADVVAPGASTRTADQADGISVPLGNPSGAERVRPLSGRSGLDEHREDT